MAQDPGGLLQMQPLLCIVSRFNNRYFVERLLREGADVNCKNLKGMTPLHFASEEGHSDIVSILLKAEADIEAKNNDGATALHLAAMNQHMVVADLLIKAGADVNAVDDDRNMPIHIATYKVWKAGVWRLLCAGTLTNVQNGTGWTPLQMAVEKSYGDIVVETILSYKSLKNCRILDVVQELSRTAQGAFRHYFETFFGECAKERENMQQQKIPNCGLTCYDILNGSDNIVAVYAQNPDVRKALKLKNLKKKYPIYADAINFQFEQAQVRRELLEQSKKWAGHLFHGLPMLPELCVEKIFCYLNNLDLRTFINTFVVADARSSKKKMEHHIKRKSAEEEAENEVN